jgi:hypothetical protein
MQGQTSDFLTRGAWGVRNLLHGWGVRGLQDLAQKNGAGLFVKIDE